MEPCLFPVEDGKHFQQTDSSGIIEGSSNVFVEAAQSPHVLSVSRLQPVEDADIVHSEAGEHGSCVKGQRLRVPVLQDFVSAFLDLLLVETRVRCKGTERLVLARVKPCGIQIGEGAGQFQKIGDHGDVLQGVLRGEAKQVCCLFIRCRH